jgi:hypothetical protein
MADLGQQSDEQSDNNRAPVNESSGNAGGASPTAESSGARPLDGVTPGATMGSPSAVIGPGAATAAKAEMPTEAQEVLGSDVHLPPVMAFLMKTGD